MCVVRDRASNGLMLLLTTPCDLFLEAYDASSSRGFLPRADPAVQLPHGFEAWDALAADLPGLCAARAMSRRVVVDALGGVSVEDLLEERDLQRAYVVLSFAAHAYVWYSSETPPSSIPASICDPWRTVAGRLGLPPILTYASYNLWNWRRFDDNKPIDVGNTARRLNFLGGQDEEHFSAVHVAIEARGGAALAACYAAHCAEDDAGRAAALEDLGSALEDMRTTLARIEDMCDPYIYHSRVRRPMGGWNDMVYEDLNVRETFHGETGAQSSLVPAIDAALGLACDDLGGDADGEMAASLVPYLRRMRRYMPPKHAQLILDWEDPGRRLRALCSRSSRASTAFDAACDQLAQFRALHLGLAYRFVRKFDPRDDDQVFGTGGTAFMPYLRAHRDATQRHKINAPHQQL